MVSGDDQSNSRILKISEALEMASENGLDLVEVSPNQDPPVCRLLDYGKFKYDISKREKKNKSKTVFEKSVCFNGYLPVDPWSFWRENKGNL